MILAVIIPAYNEARLLPRLLERFLETPVPAAPIATDEPRRVGGHEGHVPLTRRVYIVDDGSTDGTREFLAGLRVEEERKADVRVILHERNQGKGAAVRTGMEAAIRDRADIVLIQDADMEYDPRDHARLLAPILDGRADAVIGTRFGGEAHRALYYWHYRANRFITLLSNIATNLNLSDIECCLKAMTREVAEQVRIRENRFGMEPEIVAKVSRAQVRREGRVQRARVYEVAVSYAGRTYAEGKKIRWRDGFAAVWCIGKYGVMRR